MGTLHAHLHANVEGKTMKHHMCYLHVRDQQLSERSCYHLARTFLAFLSKGPDTPARKDAINMIQG